MEFFGDIAKLSGTELPPVDVITGGSPCQDLSVAGKREGLSGARSGLFMEQIRVVKEMRRATNGEQPRFMVWENVPGAFSSNKGEDFRCVLEETVKIAEPDAVIPGPPKGRWAPSGCVMGDGWSVAWRVHDAQFWGVPQRRKRIALVADFGGERAPEVLFERKGVSGDFETSGEEGQEAPGDAGAGASEAGGVAASVCLNPWDVQSKHIQPEDGIAESLYAGECRYGGGESYVMQGVRAFDVRISSDGTKNCRSLDAGVADPDSNHGGVAVLNDQGGGMMHVTEDVTGTLRAQEHGHQPLVFEPGVASRCGGHVYGGVAGTVRANAGDNQQAVVYGIGAYNSEGMRLPNPNSGIYEAETARTLDVSGGSPACNQGGMAVVCAGFDGKQGAKAGSVGYQVELSPTLEAEKQKHVVCATTEMTPKVDEGGTAFSLRSRDYKDPQIVAFAQNQRDEVRCLGEAAGALAAEPGVHQQTYVLQGNMIGREDRNGPQGSGINEDVSFTLNATDQHGVAYAVTTGSFMSVSEEVAQTLMARDYKDPQVVGAAHYTVRRLTPTECARLQGFPDGWVDIGDWVDSKGKTHKDADSPKYKALGNSIALPFWEWMARRMAAFLPESASMGSLFDGIGGFPLAFARAGVRPVWASEIEQFCIAVARQRFK